MAINIDGAKYTIHTIAKMEGGPAVESAAKNEKFYVRIEAPKEVDSIVVRNSAGKAETLSDLTISIVNGIKVFEYGTRVTTTGNKNFGVAGYDAKGMPIAHVTYAIKITRS
jgi:hypothetical protein